MSMPAERLKRSAKMVLTPAGAANGTAALTSEGAIIVPDSGEAAPPSLEGEFTQWKGYWLIPLRARA